MWITLRAEYLLRIRGERGEIRALVEDDGREIETVHADHCDQLVTCFEMDRFEDDDDVVVLLRGTPE